MTSYRRNLIPGGYYFFTVAIADRRRHLDYIHFNPVKHGLVSYVADWPHSTFHAYVRRGVYASDWGGVALDGLFGE